MIRWLAPIILVLVTPSVSAHSFYSAQCCHGTDQGGDCEPLPFDAVTERIDGWMVDFTSPTQGTVHEFVARDAPNVYDSQDGRYHVCLRASAIQRIRCFYRGVWG